MKVYLYHRMRNFWRIFFLGVIVSLAAACGKESAPSTEAYTHYDPTTLHRGDTITPFRYIHPTIGDWKVEVRISSEDLFDISKRIASRKFTASSPELLERFRKLRFIYGVGTMQRPTSTLRVYNDIKLYEQYGIVFEKKYMALQSKEFGIMMCADQNEFFDILEEMY